MKPVPRKLFKISDDQSAYSHICITNKRTAVQHFPSDPQQLAIDVSFPDNLEDIHRDMLMENGSGTIQP